MSQDIPANSKQTGAETKLFSARIPLELNHTYEGFELISIEPVTEISGHAYTFSHAATAGRLVWLAADDQDRSFAIGFKTPPQDDTGVFHILEHSVLCGSKRYPLKEPFVNLLQSSMQTFLNALTFPDKTVYPVSSTNEQDLKNLMGVYIDAVFNPNIYTKPHIFEQEGWHYEVEDGRLIYNGVVFNEMKGALSDPSTVLINEIERSLFPDTCYGYESGGDPRAIVKLSYEQFIDHHQRHYNPKNSYAMLYGDIDLLDMLSFMNERYAELSASCQGESDRGGDKQVSCNEPNALEMQSAQNPERREVSMATAPNNACWGLGTVVGSYTERTKVLAAEILFDALCGSNEAPLKRYLIEQGYADEISAFVNGQILQPEAFIILQGLRKAPANKEHESEQGACEVQTSDIRTSIQEFCRKLAKDGLPKDRLRASLSEMEFILREADFGSYPNGVVYALQLLSSWIYNDDDALLYIRYEDALAELKAGLETDYFENLLLELLASPKHSAEVEIIPTETGNGEEELAELKAYQETLSTDDLKAIAANVAALRKEQETPDSPEALQTLPRLGLADITEAAEPPYATKHDGGFSYYSYDIDTHGISYVQYYFDLSGVQFSDLPYVGILSDILGHIPTADHSAAELDVLLQQHLGKFGISAGTVAVNQDPRSARAYLSFGAAALPEHINELAKLPIGVWSRSRFDETQTIKALLTQRHIRLEQYFTNAGNAAAVARSEAAFSAAAQITDQLSGISYYRFIKDLLENWDAHERLLAEKLATLLASIRNKTSFELSFAGPHDDLARLLAAGGDFALKKGTTGATDAPNTNDASSTAQHLIVPQPLCKNEGFAIPSQVSYVALTHRTQESRDERTKDLGAWIVAARALTYDQLWNEVRVKGGAYGVQFSATETGLKHFWSYRDPALDETLVRYDQSIAWLKSWEPLESDFVGYVVSAIAGLDRPARPRSQMLLQDRLRHQEKPYNYMLTIREQVRTATPEACRKLAERFCESEQVICVFGPKEALEQSQHELEIVDLVSSPENTDSDGVIE